MWKVAWKDYLDTPQMNMHRLIPAWTISQNPEATRATLQWDRSPCQMAPTSFGDRLIPSCGASPATDDLGCGSSRRCIPKPSSHAIGCTHKGTLTWQNVSGARKCTTPHGLVNTFLWLPSDGRDRCCSSEWNANLDLRWTRPPGCLS